MSADAGVGAPATGEPAKTGPDPADRRRGTMARADARAGLALISPTLVIVLVMVVLPILWTVLLAFQRLRLLNLRSSGLFGSFTLNNFDNVFGSAAFWGSLGTTLAYSVLGTALAIGVGLVAALALRTPFRGRNLVRAAMLLPYVAPIVAVTFVLEDDAQPAVRGDQLLGCPAARLGRADRVPQRGHRTCSASRPPCSP